MEYKNAILSRLLEYLELKKWKVQKRGMVVMVLCPFCGNEHNSKVYSANIIPRTSKINCFQCKKTYNLIDVVKQIEPDKKDMSEEEILQYLKTTLKMDIVTEKDQEDLKDMLDFFFDQKFAFVPLGRKSKRPIEKGWTEKEHKDRSEVEDWLRNNLNIALRTGRVSNLTVIDVDVKPIPEGIRKIMGNPLMQETHKGYHLFYQYEESLPKTRIDELSTDIENDGGCVAVHPSICPIEEKGIDENGKAYCNVVGYAPRRFMGEFRLEKMPIELLNYLKERVTVPRKTISETIADEIKNETYKKPLIDMNEGRNDLFVHLGGMLRKQLSPDNTEFALRVLNKVICTTELEPREITAMMGSLERYNDFDEQELAHKALNYMRVVEVANSRDVKEALGENKQNIDKVLSYLAKEGYILKRGRNFHIVKKVAWEEKLVTMGKPVNFKMPYFNDVAYFNWGDMLLIGSKTKYGKTHIAMNMVKRLVDQGIKPYYLSLEAGSRFTKIALQLGLKEGDFYHAFCSDPTKVELEPNAVTIIDWLLITDKAKTDLVFKHFVEQLNKTQGILIIFQQLKDKFPQQKTATPRDKADWFAPNMAKQFPALASMYLYDDDDDGTYGRYYIEAIREPRTVGKKIYEIPCVYDGSTKELKRIDELKQNQPKSVISSAPSINTQPATAMPPSVPSTPNTEPAQEQQSPVSEAESEQNEASEPQGDEE